MNEKKELSEYIDELKLRVKRRGLKHSQQREQILRVLYHSSKHLTPEEIYHEVKKGSSTIGLATVYRTLAFLEEEKMVTSISFGSDGKKYELNTGEHHDHMICLECGKIFEFFDEEIEKLQEAIAQRNGFKLITHEMNLYGLCQKCQKK